MGPSSSARPRPAVARVRTAVPHLSAVYLPRRRLRDHLDEIRDETGYQVLRNNGQELKKLFSKLA